MKKKLVASLAAAMVLGVAGTSFAAANPFTDVPAKHWSYDSVVKLSQAGIVDGYGDGTYKGDKLISRYEMAQIVAKAMARSDKADAKQKAEIDKLAAEFAEELNNLGVRVSSLEKKVGSVKITGDARVRWVENRVTAAGTTSASPTNNSTFSERFRLNLTADVNDNTSLYARIMTAHTELGTNNALYLSDAAFTTKNAFNSDATVTVGRFSQGLLSSNYLLGTTGGVDGIKATFGNKLKVTAGFANFSNATGSATTAGGTSGNAAAGAIDDAFFATAAYATSPATTLTAAYLTERTGSTDSNFDLKGIGFTTKFAKDWSFTADYATNSSKNAKTNDKTPVFYVAKVNYKGADAKVQGTWGLGLEAFRFDKNVVPTVTDYSTASMIGLVAGSQGNYKGLALSGSYTLSKNIVFEGFQSFKSKTSEAGAASTDIPNYTRLQVNYLF